MESYTTIKELFPKYLNNSITKDEYTMLLRYFGKDEDRGDLHQLVIDALANDDLEIDRVNLSRAVDNVGTQLRKKLQPRKNILLQKYLPYAAAVLLITTITTYYVVKTQEDPREKHIVATDIKPGHKAAILTLANGKKIVLNDISTGIIASEAGVSVSKADNGDLIYTVQESNGITDNRVNTLSTANGETYQIVLTDGTKVWLNAGTTLQYSTLREQGQRKVKLLDGEAYFQVTKDKKHPFIVQTPTQQIQVLGTHFNVNSYADEGKTVTTLEEGSVKVLIPDGSGKRNILLKPGEQAINQDGHISVDKADLPIALAWRNGLIKFKDTPLRAILQQASRWYNIEVEYEGVPDTELFTGGISRSDNLEVLLKVLRLSGIRFKVVEHNNRKKLVVTP